MAIRGVHKIVVEVSDQERAKKFWTEVVGFEVTTDAPYGDDGGRWVEVTSADGMTALVLSTMSEHAEKPEVRDELPTANFFFYADDIEKTYEELASRGVEFPARPEKQPWGWWAMFTDSEGNRFALSERNPIS
ncbi:glyoxalase superfamily protein [Amycolatopsis oliviviridis]|uniref:Glyoxalase n=1 Tax=Amycolatopsis oliviviridis TaxID=1471590 RepID=A0ABQ3LL11_9PSEU|nr:glyoxalase superfamily protein [Amycolatopsis oliviviridis]GHH16258.1 glyoxalase [Amycolatopsis oliviviridis]